MTYNIKDAKISEIKFEDIFIGLERKLTHTITQNDVDKFAGLTGDFNPVHVDPQFGEQTTFGKNVVHGMLTSSFISTMIGMLIPGSGSLWTSQTLEFLNPTFINDEITVVAKVTAKSEAIRMITLEISIINQKGTNLVTGKSTIKILETKKKNSTQGAKMEQIALITGGARGIGAAVSRKLATDGLKVAINYLTSKEQAELLASEINESGGNAIAVQGDVSIPEDVEKIFSTIENEMGMVNSVVHCAAPQPVPTPFNETTWKECLNHFNTQVQGAFNCAQRSLPEMKNNKFGTFVFIGSIFTEGTPPAQQTPYILAKAGLSALAKSIAVEFGPKGIRANIVSPGMTHTQMISNIPEKTKMLAKMNTPLRQLANPEDIADVVAFLLGPSGKHVSGETIKVCGGLVM